MSTPSNDPSVFDEPYMRPDAGIPATCPACGYSRSGLGKAKCPECGAPPHDVDESPWDEPALRGEGPGGSGGLAGAAPETAVTYSRWLAEKQATTPRATTWVVTWLVALAAGPMGVIGAFWGGGESAFSALALVVFGPIIEEVSKIMIATYIVEKKPYLFATPYQLILCCAAGGFAFSVIENILYLYVYFPEPEPWLVMWRWTVCVALHTGCSLIAGLGLVRVWQRTRLLGVSPDLTAGTSFLIGAVVLHGVYNAAALAMALAGI